MSEALVRLLEEQAEGLGLQIERAYGYYAVKGKGHVVFLGGLPELAEYLGRTSRIKNRREREGKTLDQLLEGARNEL